MYGIIYRLEGKKLVGRMDFLQPDHIRRTSSEDGKVEGEYFYLKGRESLASQAMLDRIHTMNADVEGTLLSVSDNKVNCYYLTWRPASKCPLGEVDPDLFVVDLDGASISAKMTDGGAAPTCMYYCFDWNHSSASIERYFSKRGLNEAFANLAALVAEKSPPSIILSPKPDGFHIVYLGIRE